MLRFNYIAAFLSLSILIACNSNPDKNKQADTSDTKQLETKSPATEATTKEQNILFFGTSLTAGYGLDDPAQAYPALIQKKIDSLQLPYKVINGGLSGETSAAGKRRIDWLLKQPIDIFVLELGANDGLRGIAIKETESNLQDIIDKVKAKYPQAKMVLEGMQVPPNMGAKYASDFQTIFTSLATKNKMTLVPFLLDKVGGVARLNQSDGIHPTAEGQIILAENVWIQLKPIL